MSTKTRGFQILSSIVRGHAAKWLDLAGFGDDAEVLRGLDVIRSSRDVGDALIAVADIQEGIDAFLDENYVGRDEFNRVWERANEVLAETALNDLSDWFAPIIADAATKSLCKAGVELVHDVVRAAVIILEATGADHEIDLLVEDLAPEYSSEAAA